MVHTDDIPFHEPSQGLGLAVCGVEGTEKDMLSSCYRHCGRTNDRHNTTMDKEEELIKILGKLRGGSLEEVADKLLAFFREPEWWEEEFDAKFVARGSIRAFEDTEKRDAVKSFIRSLLVRVKHEECQKFIRNIEQTKEAFLAMGSAPEEQVFAMKLYAFLLHSIRQKYDAV